MDAGTSSNSSLSQVDYDVSISLASLSIIACIISLVVLIYFKLYRSFIYRLMFYSFISLIILSLSTITTAIFYCKMTMYLNDIGMPIVVTPHNYIVEVISQEFMIVSLLVTFVFGTIITLCICVLVLCNHQFTYRADIVMFISLIPGFLLITGVCAAICYLVHRCEIPAIIIYTIPILVNVFLTVLTLVPLCGRAYGCNMCVKTIRTKESHRKALKEILPLFILPLPSYVPTFMISLKTMLYVQGMSQSIMNLVNKKSTSISLSVNLTDVIPVSGALGLVAALSFALHLCFIGKAKLCKQRGRKKRPQVDYGTVNQPHTRHTTEYVKGEGIMSETCNTEHPYVNESEEDSRYLLQKNNQQ